MRYRNGDFSLEPPQGMELRQIRHAISVATTGSFIKAAELESVPVKAVVASVKMLEKHLQVQLFSPTGSAVVPTSAGRIFLLRGKGILEACALLRGSLLRLAERARCDVAPMSASESESDAKAGATNRAGTGVVPLFVLCVGPQHRLARHSMVPLATLCDETFIAIRQGDSLCEGAKLLVRHEIKPRVIYETQGRARALELIRANVGVGVLASPVNIGGIVQIPFEDRELSSVHTIQ